jgi:SAM-dependent methyltransferase
MYIHHSINNCPITNSDTVVKYFDLGVQPLANNLSDTREESLSAERFPLSLNYYPESKLTSLDFSVDSRLLFSHYYYKSGTHNLYAEHCKTIFQDIQEYIPVVDGTQFIDVGGNDGTLLLTFKSLTDKGIDVLNVDPSKNLTELSEQRGIPALNDFFDVDLLSDYINSVDVVTSTNVFQHLKDINSFVNTVASVLSDDGIWVLEFPYWLSGMETNQFDQIYHEHVYYYFVTPLSILFNKHNLRIIKVSKQDIHGGSLRLIISKINSIHNIHPSVNEYLSTESALSTSFYETWGEKVSSHIKRSKELLLQLKADGKTIYGFGAAAKGCVYLNAMELDYNTIDVVVDDTDIKQGKYIPGTGIQIHNRSILTTNPPDYILILPHNFSDYIVKNLSEIYKGQFIVLLPKIEVI